MPLNMHYILKSKVNSNDKVGNSIEKGAFTHVLKDLFHVMWDWCKRCHIQLAKIFSGNVHSVLHRFFMQTFSSGLEMKIDR